jgi:hypothetical protein
MYGYRDSSSNVLMKVVWSDPFSTILFVVYITALALNLFWSLLLYFCWLFNLFFSLCKSLWLDVIHFIPVLLLCDSLEVVESDSLSWILSSSLLLFGSLIFFLAALILIFAF